jgi:hypothetical protein
MRRDDVVPDAIPGGACMFFLRVSNSTRAMAI